MLHRYESFSKKSFYMAEKTAAFYEPVFEFNTLSILVRGEADRQNILLICPPTTEFEKTKPKIQPDKRSNVRAAAAACVWDKQREL